MKYILTLLFLMSTYLIMGQEPIKHDRKIYRSPEGKLYINKNEPVYLRIATSPEEDTESFLLEGKGNSKYINPMYFDTEGYNSIRSPWKVDPETKEYVFPKEDVIFEVYADSKPPVTKLQVETENAVEEGQKLIIGGKTKLRLNASDALSGVAQIYYSIDQAPYQKFSQPIDIDEEKSFLLKYYSIDHVGNAEKPKNKTIVTDLSEPETTHEIQGDQYQNIISERSALVLKSTDAKTEVKQTFYSLDGQHAQVYKHPISIANLAEGEHTITYYAVDKINNKEKSKTFAFFVDKTPPRVVEELLGNTFIANNKEYISGRNRLKFISMDNKAGVKEILYSINQGPFQKYTKPFYLNQSGNISIETLVIDNVNNKRRGKKLTDRSHVSYVDLSGPKITQHFEGPVFVSSNMVYISKDTRIKFTGKDDESGLKKIEYKTAPNEPVKVYEKPFSIGQEGTFHIQYTGYDNLGNTNMNEIVCQVDVKGPEIFHRFSVKPVEKKTIEGTAYSVFPKHMVLFLSATDKEVGFEKMYYALDGSNQQIYSSLIEGFNQGKHNLVITAIDKLGNQNDKKVRFFFFFFFFQLQPPIYPSPYCLSFY